jgi:hypothetical protein
VAQIPVRGDDEENQPLFPMWQTLTNLLDVIHHETRANGGTFAESSPAQSMWSECAPELTVVVQTAMSTALLRFGSVTEYGRSLADAISAGRTQSAVTVA